MQYSVKFVNNFIVRKNSMHKILILSRIEKMGWVVLFCVTRLDFLKSHFKVNCGGSEGEKVVAHGLPAFPPLVEL